MLSYKNENFLLSWDASSIVITELLRIVEYSAWEELSQLRSAASVNEKYPSVAVDWVWGEDHQLATTLWRIWVHHLPGISYYVMCFSVLPYAVVWSWVLDGAVLGSQRSRPQRSRRSTFIEDGALGLVNFRRGSPRGMHLSWTLFLMLYWPVLQFWNMWMTSFLRP